MEKQLVAVSRQKHFGKAWNAPASYTFAGATNLAPLSAQEIGHAARSLPLAFVQSEGTPVLVALLGLLPGQNLFVAPQGQWLGTYIPAVLRAYPFTLASTAQGNDQLALAVEETSGLIGEQEAGGTPFFAEDGQTPHPKTQAMLEFLLQVRRGAEAARNAVAALDAAGVIEPWPISLKDGENTKALSGISRINEKALNALPDDAFLTLKRAGALPVAYAQLIAMPNFAILERLTKSQAALKQRQIAEEAKLFMPAMEDEKFDWDSLFKD